LPAPTPAAAIRQTRELLREDRSLDQALADFAEAFGDQTERDHAALVKAIKGGKVVALATPSLIDPFLIWSSQIDDRMQDLLPRQSEWILTGLGKGY
jgi:hypothetical protein